jgi:hypothetical protein
MLLPKKSDLRASENPADGTGLSEACVEVSKNLNDSIESPRNSTLTGRGMENGKMSMTPPLRQNWPGASTLCTRSISASTSFCARTCGDTACPAESDMTVSLISSGVGIPCITAWTGAAMIWETACVRESASMRLSLWKKITSSGRLVSVGRVSQAGNTRTFDDAGSGFADGAAMRVENVETSTSASSEPSPVAVMKRTGRPRSSLSAVAMNAADEPHSPPASQLRPERSISATRRNGTVLRRSPMMSSIRFPVITHQSSVISHQWARYWSLITVY